jgi:hypothetical protein
MNCRHLAEVNFAQLFIAERPEFPALLGALDGSLRDIRADDLRRAVHEFVTQISRAAAEFKNTLMAGADDALVHRNALKPALARQPHIFARPSAVALVVEALGNFLSFSGGSPQKIVETICHS